MSTPRFIESESIERHKFEQPKKNTFQYNIQEQRYHVPVEWGVATC